MEKIDAWWFAASDVLPYGDGRKVVIGETHSLEGKIIICSHALHASRQPFDALRYAPGPYLYRVRCWGNVQEHNDKLGARHREYVAMIDATDLLRAFARSRASSVLHLWNAPQVVRDYLATGDEASRSAAWSATRAAAWSAAEAAAEAAMRAAAWSAARAAAEAAAWSATRSAAEAAAEAAAWSAARREFNVLVKQAFMFSQEA